MISLSFGINLSWWLTITSFCNLNSQKGFKGSTHNKRYQAWKPTSILSWSFSVTISFNVSLVFRNLFKVSTDSAAPRAKRSTVINTKHTTLGTHTCISIAQSCNFSLKICIGSQKLIYPISEDSSHCWKYIWRSLLKKQFTCQEWSGQLKNKDCGRKWTLTI